VTSDARLAQIITALESAGVTCLVMGGHAVRYFGVERNTNDFDLHVAPAHWNDLSDRLRSAAGQLGTALVEGPSWRPHTFRRFQIGVLPSGREEWLEFWKENHLLAPFDALYGRREAGEYGGRCVNFLSLPAPCPRRGRPAAIQAGRADSQDSCKFPAPGQMVVLEV
jgi:hypothetical protein